MSEKPALGSVAPLTAEGLSADEYHRATTYSDARTDAERERDAKIQTTLSTTQGPGVVEVEPFYKGMLRTPPAAHASCNLTNCNGRCGICAPPTPEAGEATSEDDAYEARTTTDEGLANDVAAQVLCRVFSPTEYDRVWDEWLAFDKSGWFWWARALGAFIAQQQKAAPRAGPPMSARLWTAKDVAAYLGVSVKTVYRLGIPCVLFGNRRRYREEDVVAFVAERRRVA